MLSRPLRARTGRICALLTGSVGCLAIASAGLAAQASAGTIAVTNLNDSGAGSLRQAIASAAGGETITVPAGQITLTSGALAFSKSLTIIGASAGVSVISGNDASRVFTITGTPTVTLDGLTITQGKETFGAGVDATGTLTLDDVFVSGNHAGGGGAAGFGGGILLGVGTLSLIDSAVEGNTAGGGSGGSGFGGGIELEPSENGQALALSITHSNVSGNQAGVGDTGFGGGIEASTGLEGGSISLALTESAVSDNVAGGSGLGLGFGGGIELSSGGNKNALTLTLNRSAIIGNTAGGGGSASAGFGGGLLYTSGGSDVTQTLAVTNSTIAANSAGGDGSEGFGGGMEFGPGSATLSYVTVADNSAGGGGGKAFGGGLLVEKSATSSVDSSVFAANSGGNCMPAVTSAGHNIDDGTSCGFTGAGDKQGVEAKLGALGAYGGPTPTVILLPGSPAIDAGDPATCPATDQRGIARPQGSACDSGAFEVAPPLATTGAASALAQTSVTLNGLASNPELTGGSAFFQYGTTTAYGSQTSSQEVGASTLGAPFSANLTGLSAGTLYHFRAVVISAAGTAFGADQTFTTAAPPPTITLAVTSETLSPTVFAAATSGPSARTAKRRFGTKVSYTLSEAASVRFTVLQQQPGRKAAGGRCVKPTKANRRAQKCTRMVTLLGSFTRSGSAGANAFKFTGRLLGHKLKPGPYRLVATPTAGGKTGRAASAAFRIVK
jgi:hypothetical protein